MDPSSWSLVQAWKLELGAPDGCLESGLKFLSQVHSEDVRRVVLSESARPTRLII